MDRSGFLRGIKITQDSVQSENSDVKQQTEGGKKAGGGGGEVEGVVLRSRVQWWLPGAGGWGKENDVGQRAQLCWYVG